MPLILRLSDIKRRAVGLVTAADETRTVESSARDGETTGGGDPLDRAGVAEEDLVFRELFLVRCDKNRSVKVEEGKGEIYVHRSPCGRSL